MRQMGKDGQAYLSFIMRRASSVCCNATKPYKILPDALTFAPLYISIRYMLRLRLMLCISGELWAAGINEQFIYDNHF